MAAKKTKKMVALKVLETSGVDHPAHLEEGWIVMKNANATEDSVANNDEQVLDLNDDYIDRVVELEAELAKAHEVIAELKKASEAAATVDPEEGEEDDLMKSVPEAVRELLNKAQGEADAAREELRKERQIQRDREYIAKAAGWEKLQIDASEFGVALRTVADIDANLASVIEKAFDAVNAQQEAASIFSELGGASRSTTTDAFGKVQSLAKAAVESGEYRTMEQAISGLVASNPDLYNQYLTER